MHTQEEMETVNKRYEKREKNREAKALIAAKLDLAIEKELLNRLQQGTYKGIYNLDAQNFNEELDKEEEVEEEQGAAAAYAGAEYDSEEDDDSLIGGDLDSDDEEEGENEIEEELSDEELAALDKEQKSEKADIENTMADKSTKIKKSGKDSLMGKRKKRPVSLEYEEEYETERNVAQKSRKIVD